MFHPKRLDLGGFVNTRLIRDHNKRNAFAQMEPERYDFLNDEQFIGTRFLHGESKD